MIGSLKLGAYLIGALAFLWLGWTVNNWRVQAARLPVVEADLVKERNARAASERARKRVDNDRTLTSLQLDVYRERTENEIDILVDILKAHAPVLVNNSPACRFSRDVVSLLNDARRGGDPVSTPSGTAPSGTIVASPSP